MYVTLIEPPQSRSQRRCVNLSGHFIFVAYARWCLWRCGRTQLILPLSAWAYRCASNVIFFLWVFELLSLKILSSPAWWRQLLLWRHGVTKLTSSILARRCARDVNVILFNLVVSIVIWISKLENIIAFVFAWWRYVMQWHHDQDVTSRCRNDYFASACYLYFTSACWYEHRILFKIIFKNH